MKKNFVLTHHHLGVLWEGEDKYDIFPHIRVHLNVAIKHPSCESYACPHHLVHLLECQ